jgi:hypothetical protein
LKTNEIAYKTIQENPLEGKKTSILDKNKLNKVIFDDPFKGFAQCGLKYAFF